MFYAQDRGRKRYLAHKVFIQKEDREAWYIAEEECKKHNVPLSHFVSTALREFMGIPLNGEKKK
jgi:hypothetical protein